MKTKLGQELVSAMKEAITVTICLKELAKSKRVIRSLLKVVPGGYNHTLKREAKIVDRARKFIGLKPLETK